jgi:hypothetical protein
VRFYGGVKADKDLYRKTLLDIDVNIVPRAREEKP